MCSKELLIIAFTCFFTSTQVCAQYDESMEICIPQYPDSTTIVNFPWFGNNDYLYDLLQAGGFYGSTQARATGCDNTYLFPVNIWIYRNDANTPASAITQAQAYDIMLGVNDLFRNTGSKIQFVIRSLQFEANENRRTGLSSKLESAAMFAGTGLLHGNEEFNIHFITSYASDNTTGFAIIPSIPFIPGSAYSCWARTDNAFGNYRGNIEVASTLAHELGHTLGLLHTHHPGRLPSLAFNVDNATISNGCYQESVSRGARNYWYNGCFSTDNDLKCEVNGDFLSDTNADPRVSAGTVSTLASGCVYTPPNPTGDYAVDNWNDAWNPPTRNIMSYSRADCTTEFTPLQIGVMWHYAQKRELTYPNGYPQITGGPMSCTSSTYFSAPSSIVGVTSYSWSVSPNITIVSGQTLPTVELQASAVGVGTVSLDITTPYGNFCIEQTIDLPLPPTPPYIDYTDNCPEFTFFTTDYPSVSYTWMWKPTGSSTYTQYPNSSSSKKIVFFSEGYYDIGVRTVNVCGSSAIRSKTIQVDCGSSAHLLTSYPNPATKEMTIVIPAIDGSRVHHYQLVLYDKNLSKIKSKSKIKQITGNAEKISISTDDLLPGLYYPKLLIDGKEFSGQPLIVR